jgi:hypothetical protein
MEGDKWAGTGKSREGHGDLGIGSNKLYAFVKITFKTH